MRLLHLFFTILAPICAWTPLLPSERSQSGWGVHDCGETEWMFYKFLLFYPVAQNTEYLLQLYSISFISDTCPMVFDVPRSRRECSISKRNWSAAGRLLLASTLSLRRPVCSCEMMLRYGGCDSIMKPVLNDVFSWFLYRHHLLVYWTTLFLDTTVKSRCKVNKKKQKQKQKIKQSRTFSFQERWACVGSLFANHCRSHCMFLNYN